MDGEVVYINGQDIRRLVLGIKEAGGWRVRVFDIGPEGYLKTFQSWLTEHNLSPRDINSMWVVVGPGSATALRTCLSIVNTLHFVLETDLIRLEKPAEQSDEEFLLMKSDDQKISSTFLDPVYTRAPRITFSTKDVLGRKKAG